ncbi:PREDICTED: DNA ligase 1 [Papilio xuthus]|uniref:DNA ligase n=1 Tax=Papilio xuthus TaxID=66420 RepID=A0AAJ7E6U5_PAPXU|nr:PREDICTED: DNA ligase 1 [Papilio xuthus]
MNVSKLFRLSRIANCLVNRHHKILHTVVVKSWNVDTRRMSQKSITSFFKITPKKESDGNVDRQKEDKSSADKSLTEDTSSSAAATKRSSKRLRSESVENEQPCASRSPSPVTSTKKKKVKRQRIESSGSEADLSKGSDEETIPVKLERNDSPKTYSSPKTKRNKSKLTKSNQDNVKTIEYNESCNQYDSPNEKSPKENKSPKSVKTPKKQRSPKERSESPEEKPKIKTEKKSPSPAKSATKAKGPMEKFMESNNMMRSFVKREKIVSSQDDVVAVHTMDASTHTLLPEVEYNPGKAKYHPVKDACWTAGQPVPYLALARTLEAVEATSARLKMVDILSNYFRSVIALTPQDLLPSIYLCLNQLGPAYLGLELGVAETYLMKAVGGCTGRSLAQVRAAAQRLGELGAAAQQARAAQRMLCAPAPLQVRKLHAALKDLAAITGQASVNKKISKIQALFVACRHSEAKYLIRSLEGKLRVGLAEQSLLQALALAAARTPPAGPHASCLDRADTMSSDDFKAVVEEHALVIKTTYCECPNYELVVPALLQHGALELPRHCRLTPGIPLKPMLAHPARGVHEIFSRFENEKFTCEWKYDGERAQIHVPGEEAPRLADARIFSRNQEDNTTVLSTRKRKDASAAEVRVQVCVFVFDLLLLNARALCREPLAERRRLLREHFVESPGTWEFARAQDCSGAEEVQHFLELSVRGSCEGLMVKALHGERAHYDIARRSRNWLKLKKDYLEGGGDSIDAVVIGAYRGRGRRAGRFGGFLLACYDPAGERYQTLCKIGTGFSDRDLDAFTEQLQRHVIDAPRNYYSYETSQAPDVWVEATCVWEVRCADLSLSPAHRAALGLIDRDKGVSLRFPRFVRVREDKRAEEATSAEQIARMYLAQDSVRNNHTAHNMDDDDFY